MRPPSAASKNVSVVAPYMYVPPQTDAQGGSSNNNGGDINKQGPTSFTAVGGDYMKRTQYATLNDDITQRLNDNQ